MCPKVCRDVRGNAAEVDCTRPTLKSLRYESATKQQQQEQKPSPFLVPCFQKHWRKRSLHFDE